MNSEPNRAKYIVMAIAIVITSINVILELSLFNIS